MSTLSNGTPDGLDLNEGMAVVYEELKRLAHNKLRFESKELTLNTTALVHEAYLSLAKQDNQDFQNLPG